MFALSMVMLMSGGCNGPKERVTEPPIPAQLVAHDELPFGDRESARVTRASTLVRDALEPEWGRLDSRVYTLPVKDRDAVLHQMQQNLSSDWKPVPTANIMPGDGSAVRAFARDGHLYALLLVDLGNASTMMAGVLFRGGQGH